MVLMLDSTYDTELKKSSLLRQALNQKYTPWLKIFMLN